MADHDRRIIFIGSVLAAFAGSARPCVQLIDGRAALFTIATSTYQLSPPQRNARASPPNVLGEFVAFMGASRWSQRWAAGRRASAVLPHQRTFWTV